MQLKAQDVLAAIKLRLLERHVTLRALGAALGLSLSETHASLKRADHAQLTYKLGAVFHAKRENLLEFLIHGARYAFPPDRGSITRGIPTGAGAPVLKAHFTGGQLAVWPDAHGTARGEAFSPLYRSVPALAKRDPPLYSILALCDVLRAGTAREREIAVRVLKKELP